MVRDRRAMFSCYVLLILLFVSHVLASSLTFVIDNSGSMTDDIDQVRRGANIIMESVLDRKASQIDDIVVVTFSDPEDQVTVNRSMDRQVVRSYLEKIKAENHKENDDWPEFSMTGTQRALEESSPGSYLFVFTDASAKDHEKVKVVIDLCQRKQSQVVFILTDYCKPNYSDYYVCSVYHDVARACSGHVFIINKDEVEKIVEKVVINIKDQGSELVNVEVPPNVRTKVPFKIDGKTEQAVVYVSGTDVSVQVDIPNSTKKKDFWSDHVKVIKLNELKPGTYGATVDGSSITTVTVIAKTTFLFEHGFSELKPQSLSDTSKQPIEDRKTYLSVLVQDPDQSVVIQSVELMDMEGKVIGEERPLTRISGDFYMTGQFIPPAAMFKIMVKGIANGEHITRIAKTPIQAINQIKSVKTVKYGEVSIIKCEVKSSMPLKINWFLNSTKVLPLSHKYSVSSDGTELTIKFMDLDLVGKYTCRASLVSVPGETVTYDTHVLITGLVTPKIIKNPKVVTTESKKSITLSCSATGKPVPSISWQFKARRSDRFLPISGSGANVYIGSAGLHDAGHYRCMAANVLGRDDYILELIVNMAPEVTIDEGTNKDVSYNGDMTLTCRVSAYPQARIEWSDDKGTIMPTTVQRFTGAFKTEDIGTLKLTNVRRSNKYICRAVNSQGKYSTKNIAVTVRSAFTIGEKPEVDTIVEYGKTKTIRCAIKSILPMKIDWFVNDTKLVKSSHKYFISGDGTQLNIKFMDLDLIGKYTCRASLLSDAEEEKVCETNVKIVGLAKPKIAKDPTRAVITIDAKKSISITCAVIKGTPQPQLSWQFKALRSDKFLPISGSGAGVNIPSAALHDAGHYKCVAENAVGRDDYITELIVNMAPEVTIDEGTNKDVSYNGDMTLTCRVSAYPEARIEWSDGKGITMPTTVQRFTGAFKTEDIGTLKLTNVRRSNKYICRAVNSQGKYSTKNIAVTVRSAFTIGEKPEVDTIVEYGKTKTIRCAIKSILPMKIDWFFNDTKLVKSSHKYFISGDGTQLNIKFMDLDLIGKYTCRASLLSDAEEEKVCETNVKIVGLVAPKVASGIPSITVRANASLKLSCKVLRGIPKPKITWVFKSRNSDKFINLDSSGEEINIASVALTDSGQFMCIVENVVGIDKKISEVIVEAPPTIIPNKDVPTYDAVEGDIVLRIPCNVTGYPKPVVSWRVGDKSIISDEKYSIEDNVLVIKRPVENDTHKYICEAKNNFGEANQTFEVTVTSDVDYSGNKSVVYVSKNESKQLTCRIPHTESDSIKWYLNGQITNYTGSYLPLNKANVYEDGNYTCRVSNNQGSRSETYIVDVGYPPRFILTDYTAIINWTGEEIIDCEVDAKPKPNAQWFYKGKPVKVPADVIQLDVLGWGYYSCRISNVHGSVERSFNLTSNVCFINTNTESVTTAPLLLSESSNWAQFEIKKNFVLVPSENKIKLSCGEAKDNVFQKFNTKSEINVTCDREDRFLVDGKVHKYSDFRCKENVMPTVIKTGKKCLHENTEILRVGFNLKDFLEVYEVCFDNKNNITLYTRITMSDTQISETNMPDEKWYKYPGLSSRNSDNDFTCKNPLSSCCFAKHQLVNAQDVGFGPSRISTFIDNLNAVPYWRVCDGASRSSWEAIESQIRRQLEAYNEFHVWSGASSFTNVAGANIPRYLWKIIKFSDEDTTAVVYVNDATPTKNDVLCKNICDIDSGFWIESSDQYSYCCDMVDFLTAFGLPSSIINNM